MNTTLNNIMVLYKGSMVSVKKALEMKAKEKANSTNDLPAGVSHTTTDFSYTDGNINENDDKTLDNLVKNEKSDEKETLTNAYKAKFNKNVPFKFQNDIERIKAKLSE